MKCTAETIFHKLSATYIIKEEDFIAYYVWLKTKDCFKVLVATILSQNSTDKSAIKAYLELERKVGVTPEKLSNANLADIESALKISGLYRTKAKRLKEISRIILERYNGLIDSLLNTSNARDELLKLEGIGEKTADVVLLTCYGYYGYKVFPVDTHITRVSKRLGIVPTNAKYSLISSTLKELFSAYDLLHLHHMLIAHGRQTCKARKPLCNSCIIKECCEYYSHRDGEAWRSNTS
ncbi:endonuclease III [Saccharolobus solfataricus]|uniref:thymine-DNA glycosylase n=3 Tax=Saccharolobus solfataricus TaxID=2287 RepID=Q7LXY0_SACS2|nr:endonuclease III [Saccharolobus solfataricus]AAK40470.1 DNA endonuclease III, probable (ntH-1) [Saccharolobus solfataricus P2]AKA73454.1 endonuclease III [Saccharolobus solfataricus]AKA76152.1 endonuclease III [Saccharolobus solfataricus]AKA78844.1 endonuclease III [Saccharolobus solfataricus]AZF67920.1 endonuclease III [Saccharolobus solfataricus]